MKINRIISLNISFLLKKTNKTPENLAEFLQFSNKDIWNILEGKIYIPPILLGKIADFFSVPKENLIIFQPELFTSCSEFSNLGTFDKVLDLIDEYVEVRENA